MSLPIGSKVRYHGSKTHMHGEYEITGHSDPELLEATGRSVENYPGFEAYELWPWGIVQSYRNRELSLHFVRRASITPVPLEDSNAE